MNGKQFNHSASVGKRSQEVIDLVSSDDESEIVTKKARLSQVGEARLHEKQETSNSEQDLKRKKFSHAEQSNVKFEPISFGEADIGDEVIEIRNPNMAEQKVELASPIIQNNIPGEKAQISALDEDDGIEFVGGNVEIAMDMPHQRESCYKFPFSTSKLEVNTNQRYCPNCYCYVCEVKASDCTEWKIHCNATHKNGAFKTERSIRKSKLFKLMSPKSLSLFLNTHRSLLMAPDETTNAPRQLHSMLFSASAKSSNHSSGDMSSDGVKLAKDMIAAANSDQSDSSRTEREQLILQACTLLLRVLRKNRGNFGDFRSGAPLLLVQAMLSRSCSPEARQAIHAEVSAESLGAAPFMELTGTLARVAPLYRWRGNGSALTAPTSLLGASISSSSSASAALPTQLSAVPKEVVAMSSEALCLLTESLIGFPEGTTGILLELLSGSPVQTRLKAALSKFENVNNAADEVLDATSVKQVGGILDSIQESKDWKQCQEAFDASLPRMHQKQLLLLFVLLMARQGGAAVPAAISLRVARRMVTKCADSINIDFVPQVTSNAVM